MRLCGLRQRQVVGGVGLVESQEITGRLESLPPVEPKRFEEPVAYCAAYAALGNEHRSINEVAEQPENILRAYAITRAHRFRGVDGAGAGEDRQAFEHSLRGLVQLVVAPLDRRREGPVTGFRLAGA
jgi:hypothetical protein